MNILLIRVPEVDFSDVDKPVEKQSRSAVFLPMGILHLGSYVKAKVSSIKVNYLDLHLLLKTANESDKRLGHRKLLQRELEEAISKISADIIGLSCNMNTYAKSFELVASMVRGISPKALLVAGGHYPSSYSERLARDTNVDYIVVGEGELPFAEMINNYKKGILSKGKIIDKKLYIEDLDSLPALDYVGIGLEHYLNANLDTNLKATEALSMSLLTSRGCPNRCIYCATHNVWDHKLRVQSAEQILNEVMFLYDTYNIRQFIFVDDNFILDKARCKKFCRLIIERGLDFQWYPTSVQVNSLDEEMVRLMAEAGCQKLTLAVESGCPRVQKLIRKNVNLDHTLRISHIIREVGITCECVLIFGFPGETLEEMEETVEFARKMKCDWYQMGIATPLYGTEMYEICRRNNWLHEDDDGTTTFREGSFSTPDFTKEQVEELMWDANYQLNFLENQAYLSGNYDKALTYFEPLAERYPHHLICKYMLFQIYKKQGRNEGVKKTALDITDSCDLESERSAKLIKKYNLDMSYIMKVAPDYVK